ncbi:MAG: ThuA domain-containing protein [Verrucomicrobia bacterium]|nr:MAG: ThuA domain-containing protein [Verrucomicrobiota bacterium]
MPRLLIPLLLLAALIAVSIATPPAIEKPPVGAAESIGEALPKTAHATPKKPRKLLVFSKTNGFRHESIATGKLALTELGKQTGAFEAIVSDDLENFEPERIQAFDAICFLNTTLNVFAPHPELWKTLTPEAQAEASEVEKRLKQSLMDYISKGGGFVGIHAATDTFYEWPEYGEMMNGYFDGHPWMAEMDVSIKVEPGKSDHPIVAMFENTRLDIKEEIYQLKTPYNSSAVTMLLRLDTENTRMDIPGIHRKDNDFGVAWCRHWRKGRVFYTSLGHNHAIFWHPKILSHYLAGIQWALGDLQAEAQPYQP